MLRRLLALAACAALASPAYAGGLRRKPSTSSLALSLPFTTNGGVIPDTANTVAHVTFDGTKLVDSYGNAWSMQGTVPQNVATPAYLSGFSGAPRRGAGPFSGANYYALGSGPDALDFAGDFSACFVYVCTAANNDAVLFSDGQGAGNGWSVDARCGRSDLGPSFAIYSGGTQTSAQYLSGGGEPLGGLSVTCVGRTGTTAAIKSNLRAYTTATGPYAPGAADQARLGVYSVGGYPLSNGALVEAWFSADAPSDALFTAIQRRVLAQVGSKGEPLSVTRTTVGTYTGPDGKVWTAPAGVARIGCELDPAKCGLLVEPARTNYAMRSEDLTSGWTTVLASVTPDVADFGNGANSMDQITATSAGACGLYRTDTGTPSGTQFTGSAWMRAVTGTVVSAVSVSCTAGTPASATCWRSDGGACSTGLAGSVGYAQGTIGTTPVRMAVTVTCNAALTNPGINVHPGSQGACALNDTAYFGGVQLEAGLFPTSYIPTTSTQASRNADAIAVPNPLTANAYCIEGTMLPEAGGAYAAVSRALFEIGAYQSAGGRAALVYTNGNFYGYSESTGPALGWATASLADGSAHRLGLAQSGGTGALRVDGAVKQSGAFNAGQAPAGTLTVGSAGGATSIVGGYLSDFRVYRRSSCR